MMLPRERLWKNTRPSWWRSLVGKSVLDLPNDSIPDDVVQSHYRSLFERMREGKYELGGGRDLWRLLATMTLNKVRRQARNHSTERRTFPIEPAGTERWEDRTPDPTPVPDDAAELVDQTTALRARLNPRERPIVELRLQGLVTAQIALETNRTQRSISGVLPQIRPRLEKSIGK